MESLLTPRSDVKKSSPRGTSESAHKRKGMSSGKKKVQSEVASSRVDNTIMLSREHDGSRRLSFQSIAGDGRFLPFYGIANLCFFCFSNFL